MLNIIKKLRKKHLINKYGQCAVLLYHKVENKNYDYFHLSVTLKNFEDQIKYLKNNYNILRVDQFHDYIDGKIKIPRNSLFITFDDGYINNFTNALPILEKYRIQAMFYISTANISTKNEFWWDFLESFLVHKENDLNGFNSDFLNDFFILEDYINLEFSQKLYYFHSKLLKLNYRFRDQIIDELIQESNLVFDNKTRRDYLMTEDELINFSKSEFVSIGAHTVNHPFLSSENLDIQFNEIYNSKEYLERILNKKIVDFSYPYGTSDSYLNKTRILCNLIGFKYVAANEQGMVNMFTDRYSFPRFVVRNTDLNEFKLQLKEFFK